MLKNSGVLVTFVLMVQLLGSARLSWAGEGYSDRDLVHALDSKFSQLGATASRGRIVGGWTLIGLGVTSGLGAASTSSSVDATWRSTAVAFGGLGGVFLTAGTLVLLFPRSAETFPTEFHKMPEDSPENLKKKLIAGELQLSQISRDAAHGRFISGATSIGMGLGYAAWFLVREGDLNYRTYNNGYLLYSGAAIAVLGLWTLLVKGAEEVAYEDYLTWKSQGVTTSSNLSALSFGFAPVMDQGAGGLFSATLKF